jgi:hypothetical protein
LRNAASYFVPDVQIIQVACAQAVLSLTFGVLEMVQRKAKFDFAAVILFLTIFKIRIVND